MNACQPSFDLLINRGRTTASRNHSIHHPHGSSPGRFRLKWAHRDMLLGVGRLLLVAVKRIAVRLGRGDDLSLGTRVCRFSVDRECLDGRKLEGLTTGAIYISTSRNNVASTDRCAGWLH